MMRMGSTGRAAVVFLLLAGLQRGVSFLILPFISHVMSPAEYGAASILTAAALLLTTLLGSPLEQLVFRASARGGEDAPAVLRIVSTYCYRVLPVVVVPFAALAAAALPQLFGVAGIVWAIELLAVAFMPAVSSFALPLVRARQDLRRFIVIASISLVALAGSKLVLVVIFRMGVLGWALSDLLGALTSAVAAVALVRPKKVRITRSDIRGVVVFSVPLIPHRASFWALNSLSRPATAVVASMGQVGLLSFGLNLASVANIILAEVNQALLPRYSRETFPAPTVQTQSSARWQFIFAFVVPAVIGSCVALLGRAIFDEAYWPSFSIVGILLVGQVAYGLYLVPINYVVQSAGMPKWSSVASLSGALLILAGIFLFGSAYGARGVAYVTAIGFSVMAVVAFFLAVGLKLDIDWRSWRDDWYLHIIGMFSLAFSVAALSVRPDSALSVGLACGSLLLAAIVLTIGRHPRTS